jgi:hypothetical protein
MSARVCVPACIPACLAGWHVGVQHLPWHMPREFWDMYPPTEEIDLPKHQESPTDMPPIAFTYVLFLSFPYVCPEHVLVK